MEQPHAGWGLEKRFHQVGREGDHGEPDVLRARPKHLRATPVHTEAPGTGRDAVEHQGLAVIERKLQECAVGSGGCKKQERGAFSNLKRNVPQPET